MCDTCVPWSYLVNLVFKLSGLAWRASIEGNQENFNSLKRSFNSVSGAQAEILFPIGAQAESEKKRKLSLAASFSVHLLSNLGRSKWAVPVVWPMWQRICDEPTRDKQETTVNDCKRLNDIGRKTHFSCQFRQGKNQPKVVEEDEVLSVLPHLQPANDRFWPWQQHKLQITNR